MMSKVLRAKRRTSRRQIQIVSITAIRPAPENDKIYRAANVNDPDFRDFVERIRVEGIKVPLVITADGWIISGHRRYAAARHLGFDRVPVVVESFRKDEDPDRFMQDLVLYNKQRRTTFDEQAREIAITTNPHESYSSLVAHRHKNSDLSEFSATDVIAMSEPRRRHKFSSALSEFLAAVENVVFGLRRFWPLSVRQVHYRLLSNPPLTNTVLTTFKGKAFDPVYRNDRQNYGKLTDLLIRARLEGRIPWHAINDETRTVSIWRVYNNTGAFVQEAMDGFLKGYWRGLQQSQPNHIEIVAEKLTVKPIVEAVAQEYCIPVTVGRGYCSIVPRREMAMRFSNSGREKVIVLMATDFDPDGEQIAQSFVQSLRDDLGIPQNRILPLKVCITREQVDQYGLPPMMVAKGTSSNAGKFISKHGQHVWELEALSPEVLQQLLRERIDRLIDVEAFNREIDEEQRDAHRLEVLRETLKRTLQGSSFGEGPQGQT